MSQPSPSSNGIYSPFDYAWFAFAYFFGLWWMASICDYGMRHIRFGQIGDKYQLLSTCKQRNIITYILQVVMTTLALIAQLYGSSEVLFQLKDETSGRKIEWMVFAVSTIVILYLWELVYRISIGIPLLIHHVVALLLMQLNAASFYETNNVLYLRLATLGGFYATTEQLVFIALFCYRLDLGSGLLHKRLFLLSMAQALVFKTIITFAAIAYFAYAVYNRSEMVEDDPTNWNWFWYIAFVPLMLLLYSAQLYSCQILLQLSMKCCEDAEEKDVENGSADVNRPSLYSRASSRRKSMLILDGMELSASGQLEDQDVEIFRSWRRSGRPSLAAAESVTDDLVETMRRDDELESANSDVIVEC